MVFSDHLLPRVLQLKSSLTVFIGSCSETNFLGSTGCRFPLSSGHSTCVHGDDLEVAIGGRPGYADVSV